MDALPEDRHITAAKQRLTHLAGLAEKTQESERSIRQAARQRLQAVRADLDKLRPRVSLDPKAADQYQALTLESGQLQQVLTRSREALR